jgi:hypothetical protein
MTNNKDLLVYSTAYCWGNFAGPFVVKPSEAPRYEGATIGLLVGYAIKTGCHLGLLGTYETSKASVYGPHANSVCSVYVLLEPPPQQDIRYAQQGGQSRGGYAGSDRVCEQELPLCAVDDCVVAQRLASVKVRQKMCRSLIHNRG